MTSTSDQDQHTKSFEDRKKESERILQKYPERVPVVCNRAHNQQDLPIINKKKYLVPGTMLVSEFILIIDRAIKAAAEEESQASGISLDNKAAEKTIYLTSETKRTVTTRLEMREFYALNKNEDGFLYLYYSQEATLGGF